MLSRRTWLVVCTLLLVTQRPGVAQKIPGPPPPPPPPAPQDSVTISVAQDGPVNSGKMKWSATCIVMNPGAQLQVQLWELQADNSWASFGANISLNLQPAAHPGVTATQSFTGTTGKVYTATAALLRGGQNVASSTGTNSVTAP